MALKKANRYRSRSRMCSDRGPDLRTLERIDLSFPQRPAVLHITLQKIVENTGISQQYRHIVIQAAASDFFIQKVIGFSGASRLAEDRYLSSSDGNDRFDIQGTACPVFGVTLPDSSFL